MRKNNTAHYERAISLIKDGMTAQAASDFIDIDCRSLLRYMEKNGLRVLELRDRAQKENVVHKNGKYRGKYSVDEVRRAIYIERSYVGAARRLGEDHSPLKAWCRSNGLIVSEITGKKHHAFVPPENRRNQYSPTIPNGVIYEKATLRDLAIRRPWFGGVLCL